MARRFVVVDLANDQMTIVVHVILHDGQRDLPHVTRTLSDVSLLPGLVKGRKQYGHQQRDDAHHDQHLDESKCGDF